MDVMDQIVAATLDTTATGGGNSLNYGDYILILDKVIAKQGNEGPVFIPEFFVDSATDVAVDGAMQKATSAGSTVGFPCKMNKKESASNARTIVLAALGLPETGKEDPNLKVQINNAMRRMVMPDQPLRGLAFHVTTYKYVNKGRTVAANAGKSFPRYNFTKLPNQNMATLAANKAKMDNAAQARATAQAQSMVNAGQPAPVPVQPQAPQGYPAPVPPQYPAPAPVQAPPPGYPPAQAPAPVYGGAAAPPVPVHQYPPQVPQGYPVPGQYAQAPAAPPAAQPDPFAGMFGPQ